MESFFAGFWFPVNGERKDRDWEGLLIFIVYWFSTQDWGYYFSLREQPGFVYNEMKIMYKTNFSEYDRNVFVF